MIRNVRNVRNILKLNTRICKRFSTNSEHETVLSSIKNDLLKNNDELNSIKNNSNNIKEMLKESNILKFIYYFGCSATCGVVIGIVVNK
jgi:hypothetical protein